MTPTTTQELGPREVPSAGLAASTVLTGAASREVRPSRVAYLDNLKVALVAGVIMDHAAGFYVAGGIRLRAARDVLLR